MNAKTRISSHISISLPPVRSSDLSDRHVSFTRTISRVRGNSIFCCNETLCDYAAEDLPRIHKGLHFGNVILCILSISFSSSALVIAEHEQIRIIDKVTLGCFITILIQSIIAPVYLFLILRRDHLFTDLQSFEQHSRVYRTANVPDEHVKIFYAIKTMIEVYRFMGFGLLLCSFFLFLSSYSIFYHDYITALIFQCFIVTIVTVWHFYSVVNITELQYEYKYYFLSHSIHVSTDICYTILFGTILFSNSIIGTSFLMQ